MTGMGKLGRWHLGVAGTRVVYWGKVLRTSGNGSAYSVMGVAPASFLGVQVEVSPDIWLWKPFSIPSAIGLAARLQPNITIAQAKDAMDRLLSDLTPPGLAGIPMQMRVMPAGKGFYRWSSSLRDEYTSRRP